MSRPYPVHGPSGTSSIGAARPARAKCAAQVPGPLLAVLLPILWAAALPAQAQRPPDAFLNQQRNAAERVRAELDEEAPVTQQIDFDFGGSYNFDLFIYDDGWESSRTFRRQDLRLWSRLALEGGAHEFYARTRLSYLDFNTGHSYDGNDDDWEGPNLERGYYAFDLRRALLAHDQGPVDYNLRLQIGRDLTEFGTGLALSQNMDSVQVQAEWKNFELTGLVGRTVGSSEDVDRTRPLERDRRAFFGVQARYLGWERHRPFVYTLWQRDHNTESRPTPFQEFDYDSFYVGLGSTGELLRNLRYTTEWVYESGRSYGNGRFWRRDVVEAWAFDAELEYLFPGKTRPRLSAEYLFASGDPDRAGSPTDAIGGNRGDSLDSGFVGFGYRDTGLSLAPVISNLHMWRAGASCHPWAGHRWLDGLELGTNAFLYWKNHATAAISDGGAALPAGYLGWELDCFVNWAITHDLAWTTRYGLFFPGQAFAERGTRPFFLTGVTWSF